MIGRLSAGEAAGALMLLGVAPAVFIIWYTWSERHKPGVPWFILSMMAGIGWAATSGLNPLTTSPTHSLVLYNLNLLVVALAAVFWLLLAIEYTHEIRLTIKAFAVLAIMPLVTQLLLWTNASHGLVYSAESPLGENILQLTPEPWWYVSTGYNYLLVLLASGMWLGEWVSSKGTRRRQTELFLLATMVLIGTGSLFNMIVLASVDTPGAAVFGPVAFIFGGGVIAYALTEYQLFRLTPVAREAVIREMDDGVVILDDKGKVVDANPSARHLFGFEQSTGEVEAMDLFAEYPELVAQLGEEYDLRTEITLTVDGVERDVDLNITPIEYGRGSRGRVVVFRDITSLKQRQRDLDLVKSVLTRVFRHNVRNDMTAIRGYAEVITYRAEDEISEYASDILEQSDELIEQSEKTRLIAAVIDADEAVVTVNLQSVAENAIDRHLDDSYEAEIQMEIPDEATVRAHRELARAIEQLVENAIEHHDSTPTITISTETDGKRIGLIIEDSGPGIPESEIEAVLEGEETDLKHGSGVGLWLAKWIAEYSGGELTLENTGPGTRAVIWLQRAETAREST